MGKDLNYDMIFRGEELKFEHLQEGRFVFFQRPLECGGGYWLVRTFRYYFEFATDWPVSLRQGIDVILGVKSSSLEDITPQHKSENDEFMLSSPPSGEQT